MYHRILNVAKKGIKSDFKEKNMKESNVIRYLASVESTILTNEKLNNTDKLLFIVISTLSQKYKYCYANNKYLAKIMNTTDRNIQFSLTKLKKEKYIFMQNLKNVRIITTYMDLCIDNKKEIVANLFNEELDINWLEG